MANSTTKFALNITLSYASVYGFVILITSIVCALKVRQMRMRRNQNKKQSKAPLQSKSATNADDEVKDDITIEIQEKTSTSANNVQEWFKLVKQKKSVYISLIPHVFDQATDFGVIYQYYELWQNGQDIGSANPMHFFFASCFVVILHRVASGIAIYRLTRKWSDFILQIFDLMMLKAIWVNYKLNKCEKANPQRYLEILEATFESGPQLLIATAYILKVSTSTSNADKITILMIISVLFSLWSLTSRVIADDKAIFTFLDKEKQKLWINHGFKCNKCACLHWQYVFRIIIWRFFEITNRMFLCVLIWVNLGGLAVSVIIGFEFIWCLVLSIYSKSIDPMSLMMYLSLKIAGEVSDFAMYSLVGMMLYRVVSTWLYLILVTIFAVVSFEAEEVEEYETRNQITIQNALGLFMLIYSWITSCIWPCAGVYVEFKSMDNADGGDLVVATRDFKVLIESGQFNDIVEIMEFGSKILEDDVVETDTTSSSLSAMSLYIKKYGMSVITVHLLTVLRSVIAVAPQTVSEEHLLYPLELECINHGDLLHLAIVVMMITDDDGARDKLDDVENKSTELLQDIIDNHNVDVNKRNKNDETALSLLAKTAIAKPAFTESDVNKAKILLRNGIDKNIKDKNDDIALDIVMKRRRDISHDDVDQITLSKMDEFIRLLS